MSTLQSRAAANGQSDGLAGQGYGLDLNELAFVSEHGHADHRAR